MGSAEAAELAKLAETTYRDLNIAFANELARHADAIGVDVAARDRRRQQPAVQPHPPAWRRRRRALHPRLSALLPARGAGGAAAGGRARGQRARCRAYAVELLADALGELGGARVLILGVAYRGGVKETAFSGAFPLRDALAGARRDGRGGRPALRRRGAAALGFEPWDGGAGRRRDPAGRPRGVPRADAGASCRARAQWWTGATCSIPRRSRRPASRCGGSGGRRSGARAHRPRARGRPPRPARPRGRRRRAAGARPAASRSSAASAASASRSTSTFQPASTVSTHSVLGRSVTHGTPAR